MIRKSPKAYLILIATILLIMSIPIGFSETIRGAAIAALAPLYARITGSKSALHHEHTETLEIQKLRLNNQQLTLQNSRLHELLLRERILRAQMQKRSRLSEPANQSQSDVQHESELHNRLTLQMHAVPAFVIFRSPSSWNSSLWLDVGQSNNESLGETIIAKNSPVVIGNAVIGVVDYVGHHQCRVRLITDSGLTPSVRAVRGNVQKQMLADDIASLIDHLGRHSDAFSTKEEKESLIQQLKNLRKRLHDSKLETWYLAKGELRGSSKPLWRSRENLLHGIGFNYDFPDAEGPARDLRTGASKSLKTPPMPLLQAHDLLVTTGMDGVFPAGLSVAEVTHVQTLREGDYYYELDAKPAAGNLHELSLVYVLPPVGYDPSDQPSTTNGQ